MKPQKPKPKPKPKKRITLEIILGTLRSFKKDIMATLQERFDAIEANQQSTITKLNEASTEILADLEKLRAGGGFSEAEEASMQRIEANATALATMASTMADISPPTGG